MPNARRAVQEAHERFTVGLFLDALNSRHRSNFTVISEPDPPEAIIQSNRTTRWVEVVTVYWTAAYAKDMNSRVTPGEVHAPVGKGPHLNMDACFAENFVEAVGGKLKKTTYRPFRDKYGPGYLVVSVKHPFFASDTLEDVGDAWRKKEFADLGYFRSIYLTFPHLNKQRVLRWRP